VSSASELSAPTPLRRTAPATAPAHRFQHIHTLEASPNSPAPLAYQLRSGDPIALHALAADTVFDNDERYDALLLDFDRDLGNGVAARLRAGDWASVSLPAEAEAIGSWVKLLALAPDATSAKVYLGSPSHTNAAPAAFLAELNQALGPWPGGPDDRHLGRSLIDEGTWREQAVRLNTWLRDATLRTLQRDDWDLLFAYLPIIDETQHRFLLRHPRHPDYDAEGGERRLRFNRYVEWAYQTADRFLLEWIEAAPAGTKHDATPGWVQDYRRRKHRGPRLRVGYHRQHLCQPSRPPARRRGPGGEVGRNRPPYRGRL
jgi:hypothetical protein